MIKDILEEFGPLNMGFFVNQDTHFYTGGIYYDESACTQLQTKHSVTLVGITENEEWVILNSWGERWGDRGTMRMKIKDEMISSENVCICGGEICRFGGFYIRA